MVKATRDEIKKELLSVIARLAGTTPDKLKMEDRLREDLGFDSLKSMEALSRITEIYEIDPELDEVMELKTLNDILEYMAKYLV